jgi:hypothetical protein
MWTAIGFLLYAPRAKYRNVEGHAINKRMFFANASVVFFANASVMFFANASVVFFANASVVFFANASAVFFANASVMFFANASVVLFANAPVVLRQAMKKINESFSRISVDMTPPDTSCFKDTFVLPTQKFRAPFSLGFILCVPSTDIQNKPSVTTPRSLSLNTVHTCIICL